MHRCWIKVLIYLKNDFLLTYCVCVCVCVFHKGSSNTTNTDNVHLFIQFINIEMSV